MSFFLTFVKRKLLYFKFNFYDEKQVGKQVGKQLTGRALSKKILFIAVRSFFDNAPFYGGIVSMKIPRNLVNVRLQGLARWGSSLGNIKAKKNDAKLHQFLLTNKRKDKLVKDR